MTTPYYLQFDAISQYFPGVKALDNVSFGCKAGEIHALMGENGAGKSTLLKVLSGNYIPTQGHIILNQIKQSFKTTNDALDAGIAIIYQELNLIPEMTVAENIYLGQLPKSFGIVKKHELQTLAQKQLDHLGVDISAKMKLKQLSIGQWQMVEIAKALTRDAKVIAFDEPTSSLSAREIEQLFRVIKELKSQGKVILYVSHRMEEIFLLSDAITVFKDGQYVCTFDDMKDVNHDKLVHAMVGRDLGDVYGYQPRTLGKNRLVLEKIKAKGVKSEISLEVKQGEIVGLFGLVGAGRTELLKAIFGATSISSGNIYLDDKKINIKNPIQAIKAGILLCPEDRKKEGIIAIHSVAENINISARRNHLKFNCLINEYWENTNAELQINDLSVKTPNKWQKIVHLSGGNQQKAILGRWLSEDMQVLLLDEPTRGIDVGAKSEIYNLIYTLAKSGISILFASSDLLEVIGLADRVLVMKEGTLVGELSHNEATEEKTLNLAMLGA